MPEIGISQSGWDIKYLSLEGRMAWCNQPFIGEIDALQDFVRQVNPDIILELGTRYAGTTLAMHDAAPRARIYSIDHMNTPETEDLIHAAQAPSESEYGDPTTQARRSWFPAHVRFLPLNFLTQSRNVKATIRRRRGDRTICFVDGYDKVAETVEYAGWLRPGDIMSINNWNDQCDGQGALDALLGKDYKPFMQEWSEANLALTRSWRKL